MFMQQILSLEYLLVGSAYFLEEKPIFCMLIYVCKRIRHMQTVCGFSDVIQKALRKLALVFKEKSKKLKNRR